MKNLFLCFCLVLSLCIFANGREPQKNNPAHRLQNTVIVNNPIANNEFPNLFRSIGNWFKRIFKRKSRIIPDYHPRVENVVLSKEEIILRCPLSTISNKFCSNTPQSIEVSTEAFDQENDVLTYTYQVSGGKIIGSGAKVIWDLSGVKAGIYKIFVCVDDGVGYCSKSGMTSGVTKEVKVVECPDCKSENE
jgi:hypothetical protein